MARSISNTNTSNRWKGVALPAEHGGWGFVTEPLLLGMLVATSIGGLWLIVLAMSVFLMRQPLKIIVVDRKRGRRYARTKMAERFLAMYGLIAVIGFIGAITTTPTEAFLPLLLAAPLAFVQLYYDARGISRALWPELAGATAMGAFAVSIAIAGGWSLAQAWPLWAIIIARAVSSIVYVRARIRKIKNIPYTPTPSIALHIAGLGVMGILTIAGLIPWITAIFFIILLLRAIYGLYYAPTVAARVIGFQELGLGLGTVIISAIGYML
ncbi:MAG: prenyltransferase [Chloroflexi bacterium]|nr:MAG: prenyltransferase [Chloroflexota bacterium]